MTAEITSIDGAQKTNGTHKKTYRNRADNLPGPGPGRPKGSKNKDTKLLRDAIIQAAEKAGGGKDGMVKYLTQQAEKNPTAFLSLLGKVLPTQVTGADDGPLQIEIVRFSDEPIVRS